MRCNQAQTCRCFRYGGCDEAGILPDPARDPLHGWDRTASEKNGLASIAECNFNMGGFVLPQDLPQCEKLGLGAIVLASEKGYTSVPYFTEWRKLSDAEVERRVRDMITAAGSSPAIMGYFAELWLTAGQGALLAVGD